MENEQYKNFISDRNILLLYKEINKIIDSDLNAENRKTLTEKLKWLEEEKNRRGI